MSKSAADVIGDGVRAVRDDPSLKAITEKIRNWVGPCATLGFPSMANDLEDIADLLAKRHDHNDPCDNDNCLCFAAGYEAREEAGQECVSARHEC